MPASETLLIIGGESRASAATFDRANPVTGDIATRAVSLVLQFSLKVGFENSLVGGPFISFCRG